MNDSQPSNTPRDVNTPSEGANRASHLSHRALTGAATANELWSQSPRVVPVLPPYLSEIHAARAPDRAHTHAPGSAVSQVGPFEERVGTPRHEITTAPDRATVLIVEHEFTNRMLMEKILDLGGYRCLSASNGQEALDLFDRERPDLVLTDISMPVMDGLAATAALRSRPKGQHVPIIAVSGHALREDREHALRHGCTAYLVKPYRPHDLLGLVAQLLAVSIKEGSV